MTTSNSISAEPWATVPLRSLAACACPRVKAGLSTQARKSSSVSQRV